MLKVYFLIITYYFINVIKGMVLSDGNSQLDYLFQKSLRYNHHRENYQISIRDGIKRFIEYLIHTYIYIERERERKRERERNICIDR